MTMDDRTLDATLAAYDALKDILNAADGGHPYNAHELEDEFGPVLEELRKVLLANGIVPPGEDA